MVSLLNRMTATALDKKYLKTSPPEQLVLFQNNCTETFLIMAYAKIFPNGLAPTDMLATIALDEKYLKTTSP